ncbi:hypothetical protein DFH07DRAFT_720177, partial [Mycena maculata]
ETVAASQTPAEATAALYGSICEPTGNRATVFIASVCKNAGRIDSRAAFGIFLGPSSRRNTGQRISGKQNDGRAILTGILYTLLYADLTHIHTTSKYAIRSICYWAGTNYTEGWNCANADLIQAIACSIQRRQSRISFLWVE